MSVIMIADLHHWKYHQLYQHSSLPNYQTLFSTDSTGNKFILLYHNKKVDFIDKRPLRIIQMSG